jgi:prophage regulatory protein
MHDQHHNSLAILRLTQVKARIGRCRSSIYADIKAGRFVAPIRIGPRAVGWLQHEVDEWIAARIAESRGGAR